MKFFRWNCGSSLSASTILSLLLLCSLIKAGSPLVTGKIHVMAENKFTESVGGDKQKNMKIEYGSAFATADSGSDSMTTVEGNYTNNERRRGKYQRPRKINYSTLEEKEKRELEWLVQNTGTLLGTEDSNPGSMSERSILLTFNLMRAWSRRASKKESKAPHVVERLLQKLLREKDAGNHSCNIDTAVYNIVLESWANSREEGSAERSEEILLQMERKYEEGNEDVKPNEGSYNAVIKAYVKNGGRLIAAPKVEALVNRMERSKSVSPNRRSYNLLLYCLANSSLENAASRAEDALHRMLKQFLETDSQTNKPDINSYNQVLGAWARGRSDRFEYRMQTIYEELLKLPEEMEIKPNTDTFNAVMGGWLKSNDPLALSKMKEVLAVMEQSYEDGNEDAKPDRVTINTITAAYAKNSQKGSIETSMELRDVMEKKYRIISDSISQNIVVDSWCKSGRSDSPERVIDLLNSMEKDYKNGNLGHKPDGYTYSSVIGCFIRFQRKEAPQKAEEILDRMNELHQNWGGDPASTSVYNAVINAWASSGTKEGLRRVKELLKKMEENDGEDPAIPLPNRISYNTVIKAMREGTADDAAYAEEILSILEERGQTEFHLLPDSYSYTSVITAYGRSDATNKAGKALELLKRMIQANENGNIAAKPTVHSFNAALNACAFVDGDTAQKADAFEVALKIYNLLQEYDAPDQTTYGTMIRACSGLLASNDKRREETVEEIFQKACENGSVGRLVITQMKFAATPSQHVRLTGKDILDRVHVKDLPRAWTSNVRETSRRS